MNLTALIPLLKLVRDAVGPVSLIGPPAPDENGIESDCYRADGKLLLHAIENILILLLVALIIRIT